MAAIYPNCMLANISRSAFKCSNGFVLEGSEDEG